MCDDVLRYLRMSDDGCLRISEEVKDIAKKALIAELIEMADMRSKSIVF